jgi:predicted nucleic acid-binding Zn ribbon protein
LNNSGKFSQAGEVLKVIFERLLPDDPAGYTHFFSGWEKIAGADTATHVFPRDIVNNVLILETDHPGWIQKIRMRQESLLKAIRGKYPDLEIKRIRIVIGDGKRAVKPTGVEHKQPDTVQQNMTEVEPAPAGDEEKEFFRLLETMRKRGDS